MSRRLLAAVAVLSLPASASAAVDSLRTRFEAGAGYDVTNEIYFDQPFDTTAVVPRKQVSDTDGRVLALGAARLDLHYGGRSRLSIDQLLHVGPELTREQLHVDWRQATAGDWRWLGGADVDYRHDTSFDLRRDDFQGAARIGAERAPVDYSSSLRFLYRFDAGDSRTEGAADIYPDFLFHRAQFSYSRFATLGSEWGVSYTAGYRAFPDTSARDYFDHFGDAFGRWRWDGGMEVSTRASIERRAARSDSALGDRFLQGEAEVSVRRPISIESWWLGAGARFFGTAYDEPAASFFHSAAWRQWVQVRFEAGLAWAAEATLEAEELRVPRDGGLADSADALNARREEYDQGRLRLGFERLGDATFFFEPSAGRRVYRIRTSDERDLLARSSFWFVSANGYADVPIAKRLRLRASADYVYEFHDVAADDLSALYFTTELRYALGR